MFSKWASTRLLHRHVQNCSLVHIKLDLGVVHAICRTGFRVFFGRLPFEKEDKQERSIGIGFFRCISTCSNFCFSTNKKQTRAAHWCRSVQVNVSANTIQISPNIIWCGKKYWFFWPLTSYRSVIFVLMFDSANWERRQLRLERVNRLTIENADRCCQNHNRCRSLKIW